jgi:hypothetical protein
MTKRAISATALSATAVLAVALLAPHGNAETRIEEGVKVAVTGKLRPKALPRRGRMPIRVSFGGKISATEPGESPKLTKLTIEINRHGRLDTHGLPRCRLRNIRPSTSREALAVCGSALVGEGSFSADVRFPEQSPFPSNGKVLAFNGVMKGRPAIFAHIYGKRPAPTAYVLPFRISRSDGKYGTALTARFPEVTGEWGFVTGLTMSLYRRFSFHGRSRGYLSAGCPALEGTRRAIFPLARTSFEFEGGPKIVVPLQRTCTVRR